MNTEASTYCLPEDMVEKLICSYCSSYVSCGPVKVRPNGSTICGRCSSLATEDCVRHLLFETVMSKFTFPCRYKAQGCKKRLSFGSIEHEDACPHRSFPCPSLPSKGCKTSVCAVDVLQHFEENHKGCILTEGKFKVSLNVDAQCNYLMNKGGFLVAVQYIYDSIKQELYLDVAKFSEQAISYKVQLINGLNSDHSLNIKEYPCYRYECHSISQRLARNIIMGNYLPALDNPDLVLVNILLQSNCAAKNSTDKSCSVEVNESSPLNVKEINTNLELCKISSEKYEEKATATWASLENFRCHYCRNLIFPPVYYTEYYKYYVCYECVSNDKYAAEKAVDVMTYPCRWRGCTFEGNANNIQKHITEDCKFRPYICPVSQCAIGHFTWANLTGHLQTHGTFCANPKEIIIDLHSNSNDTRSKFYFTVYKDEIISIKCTIKERYEWYLTFNLKNVDVEMYFEHDHCRFKSKTYTGSACSRVTYVDVPFKSYFPSCFNFCKHLTGFLKITGVKK